MVVVIRAAPGRKTRAEARRELGPGDGPRQRDTRRDNGNGFWEMREERSITGEIFTNNDSRGLKVGRHRCRTLLAKHFRCMAINTRNALHVMACPMMSQSASRPKCSEQGNVQG
jgi:hypothetical protein